MIICYTVTEIWCVMDAILIFYFRLFFALPPLPLPLTTQKIKILKNWKIKPGDIIILQMCTKTMDPMMWGSLNMVRDKQTDRPRNRWTDGKKWHIEVGAPPKSCIFPNIQLKGVVHRLPSFKNLSDHTNRFFKWGNDNRKIKHYITCLQQILCTNWLIL